MPEDTKTAAQNPDQELAQLVREALSEFIQPVQVLTIVKEGGGVSGRFRSGSQTFSYRINAQGVAYRPERVGGATAPGRKDSAEDLRDLVRRRIAARLDGTLGA